LYSGTFIPIKAGKHLISVNAFGQSLLKELLVVPVTVGPSAEKSEISGIPNPAHAGEPINATIIAKDGNGKPILSSGIPFSVKLEEPDNTEISIPIVDKGDGTYAITWLPTRTGSHKLTVQLNNKDLHNSPLTVNVEEAALPETSEFEFTPIVHCSVRVRAQNHKGEPRTTGGDPVKVDVAGDDKPLNVEVEDNSDGTYTVKWLAHPGTYKVGVKIRGRHVKGSPFKYVVPTISFEQF